MNCPTPADFRKLLDRMELGPRRPWVWPVHSGMSATYHEWDRLERVGRRQRGPLVRIANGRLASIAACHTLMLSGSVKITEAEFTLDGFCH